jgi:hypothetical protein
MVFFISLPKNAKFTTYLRYNYSFRYIIYGDSTIIGFVGFIVNLPNRSTDRRHGQSPKKSYFSSACEYVKLRFLCLKILLSNKTEWIYDTNFFTPFKRTSVPILYVFSRTKTLVNLNKIHETLSLFLK